VFVLMRKEELVHNPEDWVYNVAKNQKALQEGGTLRYCSTILQQALTIYHLYIPDGQKQSILRANYIMTIKRG